MSVSLHEVAPRYSVPLEIWQQWELIGELRSAEARVARIEDGRELREALARIERLERCREELSALVQELILVSGKAISVSADRGAQ